MTEKNNKLILPATILIASLILGGFYYASQVSKQRQENKEFVAQRRTECYKFYNYIKSKYSNVYDYSYDEKKNVCAIVYENPDWKEGDPLDGEFVDTDGDGLTDTYKEGEYFTKEY